MRAFQATYNCGRLLVPCRIGIRVSFGSTMNWDFSSTLKAAARYTKVCWAMTTMQMLSIVAFTKWYQCKPLFLSSPLSMIRPGVKSCRLNTNIVPVSAEEYSCMSWARGDILDGVVGVGSGTIDGDDGAIVNPAPSSTTSTFPVTCSPVPTTFTISVKFPSCPCAKSPCSSSIIWMSKNGDALCSSCISRLGWQVPKSREGMCELNNSGKGGRGIEHDSSIVGPWWRLGVELGVYGVVDEHCWQGLKCHQWRQWCCWWGSQGHWRRPCLGRYSDSWHRPQSCWWRSYSQVQFAGLEKRLKSNWTQLQKTGPPVAVAQILKNFGYQLRHLSKNRKTEKNWSRPVATGLSSHDVLDLTHAHVSLIVGPWIIKNGQELVEIWPKTSLYTTWMYVPSVFTIPHPNLNTIAWNFDQSTGNQNIYLFMQFTWDNIVLIWCNKFYNKRPVATGLNWLFSHCGLIRTGL